MCISNIGNRRPFPTNGFKSRGAVDASAAPGPLFVATNNLKDSLVLDASSDSSTGSSQGRNPKIVVQHNYHDHSYDLSVDYQEDHPARGGVTTPFPLKLHDMLDAVIENGHDHIVSWQPHGRCFVVHKPKEFVDLLPQYFKLSKLASFQRQLNLYGFQRLTRGRDRGGYYHELFLKGRVFLAHNIQRIKVKGTGVRARSNPDQEPDFWAMPWVEEKPAQMGETSLPVQPLSAPQHEQQFVQNSGLMFNNTGLSPDFFAQQFPLSLEPTALAPNATFAQSQPAYQQEDDAIVFGDKHFHSVMDSLNQSSPSLSGVEELLASEADTFFENFDFPEDIGNEIEDDEIFGDLLEQMIA